jgi:hypothetical protein
MPQAWDRFGWCMMDSLIRGLACLLALAIAGCGGSQMGAKASQQHASDRPAVCEKWSGPLYTGDHARFVINNDHRFAAGEPAIVNVVNTGTVPIGRGYAIRAARWEHGKWERVSLGHAAQNGVISVPGASGLIVRPGGSFGSAPISIPKRSALGRYRLLQRVYFFSRQSQSSRVLSVMFRVVE